MALAVEEDVPLDPVNIRFLGAPAVVASADGLPDAVEQPRRRRTDRACTITVPSTEADASEALSCSNVAD